ncbi:MAG: magnesium/cobalt transporter CorA [bacterium]|nr:magnesium/cobalt transporter CorA [bacterium]
MKVIKQKSGLPPGTMVYTGEEKTEKIKISYMDYNDGNFNEGLIENPDACRKYTKPDTVSWINVDGIHRTEIIEKIATCFGLHPLIMEDLVNIRQRPKLEDYGDYIYLVLRMLEFNEKDDEILSEQVSIIFGEGFVLSFQENEGDVFDIIRERIRSNKGKIRRMTSDYLVYSLIDSIIDNYFLILEKLSDKIEDLEEELLTNPSPETLLKIHQMKGAIIELRRSVWPLRELISNFQKMEKKNFSKDTAFYLRDVFDHTIQIIDTIETLRDILAGLTDIYLSTVSNRMNEVMKILTIIATIFIPLTFIVGVYGMNFKYMPELGWEYGYPMTWGIMIAVFLIMVLYFKRKKWF